MRVLLLASIQGNLPAFEAVLSNAEGKWDFAWCLGNVIGFGPDPNECVELLRTLPHLCLKGLNEAAVLGDIEVAKDDFELAEIPPIVERTRQVLKQENAAYLRPLAHLDTVGKYTLVYGGPRQPLYDVFADPLLASLNFRHLETPYCISGNYPHPVIFEAMSDDEYPDSAAYSPLYGQPLALEGKRKIIVMSAVAIPGDHPPEYADYVLLDTETDVLEFQRCEYDFASLRSRMQSLNFPPRLITKYENGWF
jgi:hypothetical protein